jgi:hypothetical protein
MLLVSLWTLIVTISHRTELGTYGNATPSLYAHQNVSNCSAFTHRAKPCGIDGEMGIYLIIVDVGGAPAGDIGMNGYELCRHRADMTN